MSYLTRGKYKRRQRVSYARSSSSDFTAAVRLMRVWRTVNKEKSTACKVVASIRGESQWQILVAAWVLMFHGATATGN